MRTQPCSFSIDCFCERRSDKMHGLMKTQKENTELQMSASVHPHICVRETR